MSRNSEPIGNITYRMWSGMIDRCCDPTYKDYPFYGGRGITIHAPWQDSFSQFANDLVAEIGPRPEKYQMDRIDNGLGYKPGNIRWATSKENNNNRRSSKFITFKGETLTAAIWADRTGISRQQVANRINRGWTPEEALTTPMEVVRQVEIDGEALPVSEWARRSGRPKGTIVNRLAAGMSAKEAVFGELKRRFDGICPRCRERQCGDKDNYCAPCRKAYIAERSAKKAQVK
jgi:hypothetical protein